MFYIQYLVNADVANGLSGHRKGKWYTPEKINETQYLHTTYHEFNSYDEAVKHINKTYKYPDNVNIVEVKNGIEE